MEFKRLLIFALVTMMLAHGVSHCDEIGCGSEVDSPPPPLVVECGEGCTQIIPPPPVVVCGGGCIPITQSPPPLPPSCGHSDAAFIINVLVDLVVVLQCLYFATRIYDSCCGKGRERRLKRIRKRNEKIEKALKQAREQTQEIGRIEGTMSRMEEGIKEMKRESASSSCSSEVTSSMESEDVEDVDATA